MLAQEITPLQPLPQNRGNGSELQIFMHPFFGEHPEEANPKNAAEMMRGQMNSAYGDKRSFFVNLIYTLQQSERPFLLGEEEGKVDTTLKLLELLGVKCLVYYFVTLRTKPIPKNGEYAPLLRSVERYGPEAVAIGGQLLYIDWKNSTSHGVINATNGRAIDGYPQKCVGTFARECRVLLPAGIPVMLSRETYPDRTDWQGTHGDSERS